MNALKTVQYMHGHGHEVAECCFAPWPLKGFADLCHLFTWMATYGIYITNAYIHPGPCTAYEVDALTTELLRQLIWLDRIRAIQGKSNHYNLN